MEGSQYCQEALVHIEISMYGQDFTETDGNPTAEVGGSFVLFGGPMGTMKRLPCAVRICRLIGDQSTYIRPGYIPK